MQIKITSGKSYAVLGLDGAQLNSLVKNDTEYLWQGDEKYWSGQALSVFRLQVFFLTAKQMHLESPVK